jgi:hypothetical protein
MGNEKMSHPVTERNRLLECHVKAAAISGDFLSAVISIRYILGFRKDNPNVFNMLVQNLSHC